MDEKSLAPEYLTLWRTMEVRPEWRTRIATAARRIAAGKERYQLVERETGVSWWVVGIIHHLESQCDFTTHLHNGDPLTERTKNKPRGRPLAGSAPFRWEESAADALRYDKLDRVEEWTVPALAYALESYNGTGYRKRDIDIASPYLWSGTTHYTRGKFARDGKYVSALVSEQPGAMAIARELAQIEDDIDLVEAPPPDPAAEHQRTPGPPSGMGGTTEGPAAVTVGGVGGWQVSTEVSGAFGKVASSGKPFALGDLLLHIAASPTFWVGAVTVAGAAYWWLRRSAKLRQFGV